MTFNDFATTGLLLALAFINLTQLAIPLTIDTVRVGNETLRIFNWAPASENPGDMFFQILSRYSSDYKMKQEILHMGCDCVEIQCDFSCCICRLDCAFPGRVDIGDMWMSRIFGNCSDTSILRLGKSSQVTSSSVRQILYESAGKNYWMCDESVDYQTSLSHFHRFLCVRSDNAIHLGVFYPERTSSLIAAELRTLIEEQNFWSNEDEQNGSETALESSSPEVDVVNQQVPHSNDTLKESEDFAFGGFEITGPDACREFSGFPRETLKVSLQCLVILKLSPGFACEALRSVMDDVAQSFFNNVSTNPRLIVDPTTPREVSFEDLDQTLSINSSDSLCLNITKGLRITVFKFGSKLMNISCQYLKGSTENETKEVEFPVVFATISLESEQTSHLSQFFKKYFMSNCPDQYCWRDLIMDFWNACPSIPKENELLKFHELHEIFNKIIVVLVLVNLLRAILDGLFR